MDALTFAQEQGQLSTSQEQAMITLLEKKDKDRRFIKNWRPISLINVDVNIDISNRNKIRIDSARTHSSKSKWFH